MLTAPTNKRTSTIASYGKKTAKPSNTRPYFLIILTWSEPIALPFAGGKLLCSPGVKSFFGWSALLRLLALLIGSASSVSSSVDGYPKWKC